MRISQVGAFADAKALQQQLDAKSLELDQALRDLAEARGSAAQSEADGRADAAPGAVSLEDEVRRRTMTRDPKFWLVGVNIGFACGCCFAVR